MLNKNLLPISIIVAVVIIGGVLMYTNQGCPAQEKTEGLLTPQEAAQKAVDYINKNMMEGGQTASLISVLEESGLYKFKLKIGENEYDSYVTEDGKLLFPQEGVNLEETPIIQEPEVEATQPSTEIAISPEELKNFIECLKKADFVIYGANWCGWTKKLVEMLGGRDMVEPIYVECTEKTEICEEKGVRGYPTILIDGEQYQGARTFEEFSVAVGCQMPAGAETLNQESPSGGCQ